jgi:DNA-binding response OmpR family regulator
MESGHAKRILLVEDDDMVRRYYERLLQTEGYEIELAVTGEEAYQKMSVGGYNLVLLDLLLPDKGGLKILQELKDADLPKIANDCVILLTNLADDNLVARSLEYNVAGYMVKSEYSPEAFMAEIKKHLETR